MLSLVTLSVTRHNDHRNEIIVVQCLLRTVPFKERRPRMVNFVSLSDYIIDHQSCSLLVTDFISDQSENSVLEI